MFEQRLTQMPDSPARHWLVASLAALPITLVGGFALAYASGRLGLW